METEPAGSPDHDGVAHDLDRIIEEGLVVPVFQPIVELATERVVAYEALARGPRGSALERPDQLFAAARATGRLHALDWAVRSFADLLGTHVRPTSASPAS